MRKCLLLTCSRLYSESTTHKVPTYAKIKVLPLLKQTEKDLKEQNAQKLHILRFNRRPRPPAPRDPDLTTPEQFLSALGRNLNSHASKFTSWEDFFVASSTTMDKRGIGCRERKYILKWKHKYRYE